MRTKTIFIVLTVSLSCFHLSGYSQHAGDDAGSVKIGDQVWMAENLNVSFFRNGDPIMEARTDEEWIKAGKEGKPAWCHYNNTTENGKQYGKLYNWFAVMDPRGLAPEGWHIPGDREWTYLTDFLGGDDYCGILMKSTDGWINRGNGNNQSGFNGLPGGARNYYGMFQYAGELAYWWTSTPADETLSYYRAIDRSPYYVYRLSYSRMSGFSVRCIKN